MSEMVDRVARAIAVRAAARNSGGAPVWASEVPEWRMVQAREEARAAIAAMREPTIAMVDAIQSGDFDIYWSYHADGRPGGPEDVWMAMIDAAFTPEPEEKRT